MLFKQIRYYMLPAINIYKTKCYVKDDILKLMVKNSYFARKQCFSKHFTFDFQLIVMKKVKPRN